MQEHRLPVLEKIGFGAGDAAVNVVISLHRHGMPVFERPSGLE